MDLYEVLLHAVHSSMPIKLISPVKFSTEKERWLQDTIQLGLEEPENKSNKIKAKWSGNLEAATASAENWEVLKEAASVAQHSLLHLDTLSPMAKDV